jgi:general secretion pathway protein G
MRTNHRFSMFEVAVVAAVLGAVSLMTLPRFSQAGTDQRLNTLCDTLQSVRSQLTLYHVQHDGRWPATADFVDQMTGRTNALGTACAADGALVFGPYLDRIPANPFTGGNTVNGGDWRYDETTGRFAADDEGITRGIRHRDL